VIIVALFAVQRVGTAKVGRSFGPVMVLWFISIGLAGVVGIAAEPGVLRALSPTQAIKFAAAQPASAFFALAAVVLAITGAEALYADLGHFGRRPITLAWLALIYPACTLSYFGQGASILADPNAIRAPFFLLVPPWAQLPMVLLATAATVIASQAVITGAFSVARQAVQLGYLPRLRILHTSSQTIGQIYVPYINWALMIAVVALVLGFQTSAALAYAFGMAVTGTILITTLLLFYLARTQWGWPIWLVLLIGGPILALERAVPRGQLDQADARAWLPLLISVAIFTVFTTWQRGRQLVTARREAAEGTATRLRRRPARAAAARTAGARHCRVPQPRPHHNSTGHAVQRPAQPRAASTRRHRRRRDRPGARRPTRGARGCGRARLHRRPNHTRHDFGRLHATGRRARHAGRYPR
jgi:KUP system potassium uptake protein